MVEASIWILIVIRMTDQWWNFDFPQTPSLLPFFRAWPGRLSGESPGILPPCIHPGNAISEGYLFAFKPEAHVSGA
jgi:hypothetical protein